MTAKRPQTPEVLEHKKRRRERVAILAVGLLFCILTYVEIHLSSLSQRLPFVNSIFFFGLINFNIILLLFLFFLIFRNVVKLFSERRGKLIGSSLKGKLVLAFTSFSFFPTVLLFMVSVFYINSSFDKWFSIKIGSILQDSLEVTGAYYQSTKKKNYHFAHRVAEQLQVVDGAKQRALLVKKLLKEYSLDAVEIYPGLFEEREVFVNTESQLMQIPAATLEFLQKGISQHLEASTIHQFTEGNLIRCIVPLDTPSFTGAVIVSSYVPLSLVTRMDTIASSFEDYKDVNPLKYPIKSIYLVILAMITLIIFFGASWFGFHLARQLTIPLEALGAAAKDVAAGKFKSVSIETGSQEIAQLISSFNRMTNDLRKSEQTLKTHARYVEIILSNISAGVVSVDQNGKITTINKYAAELLGISPKEILNQHFDQVLRAEYKKNLLDMVATIRVHKAQSIQREMRVRVKGEQLILRTTLSPLKDDAGNDLGMVMVFDDLTQLVAAQRQSAWREVARRIAHEIKNPLTPIRLSAERLSKKFSEKLNDPTFDECTTTIISQVDALKDLVNEFSDFARLPQAKMEDVDLTKLTQEALTLYRQAHEDIAFELNLSEGMPKIKLDRDQTKRLVINLLENSVAALREVENPSVAISTHHDSLRKTVVLSVADNGSGIPPEIIDRIFEPYFSTKEDGSGLGLAIVKKIVEDHSGNIKVMSNPGNLGTKFVVEFPVLITEHPIAAT